MQHSFRLDHNQIAITMSKAHASKQEDENHKYINMDHLFLSSHNEEKAYRDSCIGCSNGAYRKLL